MNTTEDQSEVQAELQPPEIPLSEKDRLKGSGENLQGFGWLLIVAGILVGFVSAVNQWFPALLLSAAAISLGILLHIIAQLVLIRASLEKTGTPHPPEN